MTETDWAPAEPTEEEEAEMRDEEESASGEEPVKVHMKNEDEEDSLGIDKRPPSERYSESEESDIETTTSEDEKPEKTAETDTSETTETKPEPDWWDKMSPEEQRKHVTGLQSEMSKVRETRRDERDENERRVQKMMEDKLSESKQQNQPAPEVPDQDYDPEEHAEYWKNKESEILAREQALDDQQGVTDEKQRLDGEVGRQVEAFRVEHSDYDEVFQQGRAIAVEQAKVQLERAHVPNAGQVAEQRVAEYLGNKVTEIMSLGGNVAAWSYQEAKGYIGASNGATESPAAPTKPSGESTAAAITAGEKAAKGLGKGGSGSSVGELTPESISRLRGDEFDKALDEWENKVTGERGDWTP